MQKNNTVNDVIRVAIYIRVSTDEQAIHGLSLDAQRAALEQYAKKQGYKIVGTYIDGGKTARKAISRRLELQRLLSDVERGEIDLIIFTKLDRWFRNIRDYYKVQEILENNHVNWKTVFENYDTTTANGRLHINIMLSIAQDEADRCSERIKAVFASKLERGEGTCPCLPIGYKLVNSKIVIDPDGEQLARDLFEHYYTHQSQRAAARAMVDLHGVHLHPYTVKRMLTNPIYKGEYRGRAGFCEPLVSASMFAEIQDIIKNRNIKITPGGYDFIFSGLLVCSECGCHMSGNAQNRTYAGGRRGTYVCYRCNRNASNGICSHSSVAGEKKIEQYLLTNIAEEVQRYIRNAEAALKPKRSKPKINKSEIRRRLERLKELYINDLIDIETYKKDFEDLNAKLATVEVPQPKRDLAPLKEFLKADFKEMYNALDNEARRVLWRGIIREIRIDANNNMEVVFL